MSDDETLRIVSTPETVVAYHGCELSTARQLLEGAPFRLSANNYDWLGSGVYFWEANPFAGIEFAREWQRR